MLLLQMEADFDSYSGFTSSKEKQREDKDKGHWSQRPLKTICKGGDMHSKPKNMLFGGHRKGSNIKENKCLWFSLINTL